MCCASSGIDFPNECPPYATFNIVKWVAASQYISRNGRDDVDMGVLEVVPTGRTDTNTYGKPLRWGSIAASDPCSGTRHISYTGFPTRGSGIDGCNRLFNEDLFSSSDQQSPATCGPFNFPKNNAGMPCDWGTSSAQRCMFAPPILCMGAASCTAKACIHAQPRCLGNQKKYCCNVQQSVDTCNLIRG